jgi:hypothetical protein
MSIYIEGLKFLPLFGGKGEINTPGKWFAFAATFLSVAAIFMGERFTGQSTGEMMRGALTPFGLWAGVAIAGIMTLIVFLATRETEAFKKHTLIGIALAFSVGLMFSGHLISEPNLLGYGVILLIIAAIGGAIAAVAGKKLGWGGSDGGSPTSPSNDYYDYNDDDDDKKKVEDETEEGEKEAEKLEKFSIAEFAWLKKVNEQLDKEFKNENGRLGDTRKFKYIKVRREERTLRKMRRRVDKFVELLRKLQKNATAPQKRKINNWINKIEIYWKSLIKLEAKDGEFDKVLGTLGAKFGAHVSKYVKGDAGRGGGTKAKYLQLKDILHEAIRDDQALVEIFKKVDKEFKLEEEVEKIKK